MITDRVERKLDRDLVRKGMAQFWADHPRLLKERRMANVALIISIVALCIAIIAFSVIVLLS